MLSSLDHEGWLGNEENYVMMSAFPGASVQRRSHILNHKNKLLSLVGPIYVSRNTIPGQEELTHLIRLNGGKVQQQLR